ncbi:MAG: HAD family hydrolase [Bacteroidetes bacterium]|nr:HAD family hydrolase [Bacteroidota bacterium]
MVFLFDLDNTLLDDNAAQAYYLPLLYSRFKEYIHCSEMEFRKRWKEALPYYHQLYAEGKLSFEEQRRYRFQDSFKNYTLDTDTLAAIGEYFQELLPHSWKLFDDVIEVLEYLRPYPLGIITNGALSTQSQKIDSTGIRGYFDCIVISEAVGCAKPDPAIFLYATQQLHCSPEECYFIGDSWENDVRGSIAAGMKAVWLNYTNTPVPEDRNDVVIITRLRDLLRIVHQ